MSLSTKTLHRLPTIKQGIMEGLNRTKIGEKCGVTEKTIDRDVRAWVDSGLFEVWLKEEFLRLHSLISKTYPELAYKEVSRIIGRMVTRKVEAKTEYTKKVLHVMVSAKLMKNESTNPKTEDKLRAT